LWGDGVLGYHLTNVVLHVSVACLLVAALRKLGFRENTAWLAAFLFALHPVAVEAVAWISEQKSTLSAVFYLASALVYLDFDRSRKGRHYAFALVLFTLALLTKTVTATLPAALLLVFWWQRGRLSWKRDVLPLMPWLALGAIAGLFTAWVERNYIGAQGSDFALNFLERTLLATRVVWFYLWKLTFPVDLMFFYRHWTISVVSWWQWSFAIGLLALVVFLFRLASSRRGPLTALLFLIGTLFPVLGFFNVYPFIYSYVADHFAYLASLGVVVPAAILIGRWPAAGAAVVAVLAILTWRESRSYRNDETLYTDTLQRNPSSWISHNNLGSLLLKSSDVNKGSRLQEAIGHFQTALQLKPDSAGAHNNLGSAYERLGRLPNAITEFRTASKFHSDDPLTLDNLGSALLKVPGRADEALADLQKAVRLSPDFADAHNNLGVALSKISGRLPDAIAEYKLALELDPLSAEAHNNLAAALYRTPNRMADAAREFEAALRLNPDSADAHNNLAGVLMEMGRLSEAMDHLHTALHLNPDLPDVHANLGLAYSKIPGRLPEAIEEYRTALRLNPAQADAHNNLGLALDQSGRKTEALPHFESAVQYQPNVAQFRINLGNALAGMPGRLPEAITQFQTAVRLRPDLFAPHFLLGLSLLRMQGHPDEALSQLKEALRIQPDAAAQRIVDKMSGLRRQPVRR
jgi:tetratricopeptide (TPR) repeat protein